MTDNVTRLSPHAAFWVLFFSLALMALLLFAEILLPFVAGFVLAYLFHPVVNRMHRVGISRGFAAFAIIAFLTLAIAAIVALILPPLIDQLGELIRDLPGYIQRGRAYLEENYGHYLRGIQQKLTEAQKPGTPPVDVQQQIAQNVTPWVISQLQSLLQGSLALFNSLALLFLTPVVTFFLLRDWDKMIAGAAELMPRQDAPKIVALAKEINTTIAGYLRGTVIVLVIISTFYMVALGLVGLHYGLLIGLGAGLISFVPYLGSTGGFLVSGGVALAQFWPDYTKIAIVCAIFVFGQVIEGNILTPNIVGNQVRLHPVWLLFALIASGYLLGFTGLLISVPLAAAIGVMVRHLVRQYYSSPMYDTVGDHDQKSAAAVE
jgi:predicted PurR-regulated permease PerM